MHFRSIFTQINELDQKSMFFSKIDRKIDQFRRVPSVRIRVTDLSNVFQKGTSHCLPQAAEPTEPAVEEVEETAEAPATTAAPVDASLPPSFLMLVHVSTFGADSSIYSLTG